MANKPKGFRKFDALMRKLVKVSPKAVAKAPDRCRVCGGLLEPGEIELGLTAHRMSETITVSVWSHYPTGVARSRELFDALYHFHWIEKSVNRHGVLIPFAELAWKMADAMSDGPTLLDALRQLEVARDSFVRADAECLYAIGTPQREWWLDDLRRRGGESE